MTNPNVTPSAAAGVLTEAVKLADEKSLVQLFTADHGLTVAAVPNGRSLVSMLPFLDALRPHPRRRQGEVVVLDTASFVTIVKRWASQHHTLLFANPEPGNPTVQAVFDHHTAGPVEALNASPAPNGESVVAGYGESVVAGYGEHRAMLALRLSDEWKRWTAVVGRELDQVEFASFLQDRIGDLIVVDPADEKVRADVELFGARLGTPQAVVTLSRGIEINAKVAVKNAVTLEDGSCRLSYIEEHTGAAGATLTVPTLFYIAIPVFYAGEPYRIPVRIRYRMRGPAIVWALLLQRQDRVFDDAFNGVVGKVREETALPVVIGANWPPVLTTEVVVKRPLAGAAARVHASTSGSGGSGGSAP